MSFAVLWASLTLLPASADPIVKRNIFCSGCTGTTTVEPPGERVSLPLELVAILRAPDGRDSRAAIFSKTDHQAALYAVGARVGEARVSAIGARRVWLRVGSRTAELSLDDALASTADLPTGAAPQPRKEIHCTGARCEVDGALVKRLLADPSSMAQWARVAPSPRGGLLLLSVRAGTPLAQLGLESGDRLHALNGVVLGDVPQMLDAYVKLKTATRLSIALERKGALHTLDYLIR